MSGLINELQQRGLIAQTTDAEALQQLLDQEQISLYCGFDPTADSLHIGHLLPVLALRRFQLAGHKPIALVGGATGMIGDPSFKAVERSLNTPETVAGWVEKIRNQLTPFLSFDGENAAVMANNHDWFGGMGCLDFLRDIGKHFSVNAMMNKESVKQRLDRDDVGISFTEFAYSLLQAYDFTQLNNRHACKLQIGGSDQWGNITSGIDLTRRLHQQQVYGLTVPLITKADGTKFGKTESGAIWLDPEKTSPYKYYQFWLNASDDDVKKWIRIFTLKTQPEIEALEVEHDAAPHLRILQKALSEDITLKTHSLEALETAIKTSEFLFGNGSLGFLQTLDAKSVLEIFEGVPQFEISKAELAEGIDTATLLAEKTTVFSSKGEVKKTVQGGGLSINKTKVADAASIFSVKDLINDKFIIVQKGKKNYFLLIAE